MRLSSLSVRFYVAHFVPPLLFAAFMIWIYPQTNWDLALISPYFDAASKTFYLKNNFLLEGVMHEGLKSALFLIPILAIAGLIWGAGKTELAIHRRRLIWLLLGLGISTLLISALKRISIHACPWDLQMFGGYAPLLPLFADLPAGINPGRCLPGGHASGGFSLLALYFVLRDDARKWAYFSLGFALVLGFAMGWTQMMRGAHFLSHNLWTMWWVWMTLLVLYLAWPPVLREQSVNLKSGGAV